MKVTYDFCKQNGSMDFVVLNKLNIPLYIDWRKSSFIYNGVKLDLWYDATSIKSLGINNYTWGSYYNNYYSTQTSNSVMVKQERITFIAPNSTIKKETFVIYPQKTDIPSDVKPIKEHSLWSNGELIGVRRLKFDLSNTPASFRNFMTLSTTERFDKEFYIDNGFYISGVMQIKESEAVYNYSNDGSKNRLSYSDPKTFYVR